VFEEACRCSGVLRVHRIADLFRLAEMVTMRPAPKGRRLTILTNARGPGLLAADALKVAGGRLAPLAPATVTRLGQVLTPRWNQQNPIDIGDDADLTRFHRAAAIALEDATTDALLVVLTPHAMIDPVQAAESLRPLALAGRKPLLACWMWGACNPESLAVLQDANMPTFRSPQAAVRAFGYLWRHGENLRCLAELSAVPEEAREQTANQSLVAEIVAGARRSGRSVLTRGECQQLLSAYALPTVETRLAASEREAVEVAEALEYPVVLGLASATGLAEPEGEGIELKAFDAAAVRRAVRTLQRVAPEYFRDEFSFRVKVQPLMQHSGCAIALRSTTHPELGPVIQLGVGGFWATLSRDRVIALPPLSPQMVRRLIEDSPLFAALRATPDGEALDFDALQQFLMAFSRLVVEQPWIRELTINPLLVSAERVLALDARVVVHDQDIQEGQLPGLVLGAGAPRPGRGYS
jgi:acetyltransferase